MKRSKPKRKPTPTPAPVLLSFRLEAALKQQLDAIAVAERRSTASLVNKILYDWLKDKV